ncbi:MAG TPA: DUF971 domain-containing protein [Gammaproteobacteria bacterium]|nr:DUF971 domain-containing protein [Gammaproteobacteria bacterium]
MSHPVEIRLRKSAGVLAVSFDDGARFELPFEYLRVFSPSAEVRGHGTEILQVGKERVKITGIEPVGSYAVRLIFDDGHDTGLYSWPVLYELGREREANWARYLQRLEEAGVSRQAG